MIALQKTLQTLRRSIIETERVLDQMRAEHDPLAFHIFAARRSFRNLDDHSKSGHHKGREADNSYRQARELGYRGDLQTWYDLMTAEPKE